MYLSPQCGHSNADIKTCKQWYSLAVCFQLTQGKKRGINRNTSSFEPTNKTLYYNTWGGSQKFTISIEWTKNGPLEAEYDIPF